MDDAGVDAGEEEALASMLLARGLIDARGLDRARRAAGGTVTLDMALTQLGLVSERNLAQAFADRLGRPLVTPEQYPEALPTKALSVKFLRRAGVLPLAVRGGRVELAMIRPFDRYARRAVEVALGLAVEPRAAVPIELEAALDRLAAGTDSGASPIPDDGAEDAVPDDAARLRDLASEAPVVRLVGQLIAQAVELAASDLHLEPVEHGLAVRLRVDGVLHEMEPIAPRLAPAVVSRLKIMARLDIAERRLPQDGRMRATVRGQAVDFRVSILPALLGESVVLRVLDKGGQRFDFDALGLSADRKAGLLGALERTSGIILLTGPTGSGKTTMLYTILSHIDSARRKVVTVEDPVEYRLAGIVQFQVKPQIDLTFARLLRSILRHDPDVIMVGEIRDLETAQIAVQAALTGHGVLSTLHTNNAVATLARLRDMGIEDYLIAATLNGVLAQRLVRRLCPDCKEPFEAPPELARLAAPESGGPVRLHRAVGCPKCRGTGYRGRMVISEWLGLDGDLRRLVLERADPDTIRRAAVASGFRSMFQDGLDRAVAGITTVEDVLRSIRED